MDIDRALIGQSNEADQREAGIFGKKPGVPEIICPLNH